MLTLTNLTKNYPGFELSVPELILTAGEIVGLVGNNGAGKTTLLKIISDLVKPDLGKVVNYGEEVSTSEKWKEKTGIYLNESFLIPYLRPLEYLELIRKLKSISRESFDEFILRVDMFSGTIIHSGKYIRELSAGNRLKIGITGAMIGNPRLLMLDEPYSHLDPGSQIELTKLLRSIRTEKQVTFVSSHNLDNIERMCDRIILLHEGEVLNDIKVRDGKMDEIRKYFEE